MMAARLDRPDHAGEIRRALDGMGARAVLEALGLAKGAQRQRGGLLVCCPAHAEHTPSCSVQDTDRGIAWHCFGCDAAGDALALVAAVRGLSTKGSGFVDTLREAAHVAGLHRILDELDARDRNSFGNGSGNRSANRNGSQATGIIVGDGDDGGGSHIGARTEGANVAPNIAAAAGDVDGSARSIARTEGVGAFGVGGTHANLDEAAGIGAGSGDAKASERLDASMSERSPVESGDRTYPDRADVAALWRACVPVLDLPEAANVLRFRGLSPEAVELHDLARALPDGCPLSRWARFAGRTWLETGHRLLLPVFDEAGHMRSLRAWRVLEGQTPKRLPPAGHKAGGLVLANALGRMMLETGARPEWWPDGQPFDVVITEGEPDFIARACWYSDADELAPAVLGIAGSGAWSQAIADRIPTGARVFIRTDLDEAGERYARDVARTIGGRCPLLRQRKDAPT